MANDRGPGALSEFFQSIHGSYVDQTEALANSLGQIITFEHVPTGVRVTFKAFLTSYSDTYDSKWTGHSGYGRMDDVQMFQATTRRINLSFDVVAGDLQEAKNNMGRISTFAQMLYPTFEGGNGPQTIKAAPLLKLKFMNWAQDSESSMGLLGVSRGFSFTPTLEPGVFTARNKTGWNKNVIYPKVCTLATDLTVIHQHQLGWRQEKTSAKFMKQEKNLPSFKRTTTWFQPQAETFPYGDRVMDSPLSVSQKGVKAGDVDITKNPNWNQNQAAKITKK